MIPIHELLNCIRRDREFTKGNFELGYYDRTENRIIRVLKKAAETFRVVGYIVKGIGACPVRASQWHAFVALSLECSTRTIHAKSSVQVGARFCELLPESG